MNDGVLGIGLILIGLLLALSLNLIENSIEIHNGTGGVYISYGDGHYLIHPGETSLGPWGDTKRTCRVKTVSGEIRFAPRLESMP